METQTIDKALVELRKEEKRKFIQTVDLVINFSLLDALFTSKFLA